MSFGYGYAIGCDVAPLPLGNVQSKNIANSCKCNLLEEDLGVGTLNGIMIRHRDVT
jgi:hypothetical protein